MISEHALQPVYPPVYTVEFSADAVRPVCAKPGHICLYKIDANPLHEQEVTDTAGGSMRSHLIVHMSDITAGLDQYTVTWPQVLVWPPVNAGQPNFRDHR